jgi:hypothetical protein
MKFKKATVPVYDDILTVYDTPLVTNTQTSYECAKKKKVVVKKEKVPAQTHAQTHVETRKVSTYNMFIKEKRLELMESHSKLSKAEIYEMAKQAYRDREQKSS